MENGKAKRGINQAYPSVDFDYEGHAVSSWAGMTTRLVIAKDAMCALLSNKEAMRCILARHQETTEPSEISDMVADQALLFTDALLKREEATRDE